MSRPPLALTSAANPRIKAALQLQDKAKARAERGLFVVEGVREIARALTSGYEVCEVFQCDELLGAEGRSLLARVADMPGVARFTLPKSVYARLAVRESVGGLVAVFRQRTRTLASLELGAVPLLLAMQGVEKPGNVGALLRSADGAGATAVVLLDQALDLGNPGLIRASLGTAFSMPTVSASTAEFAAFCQDRGLKVYGAALSDRALRYDLVDWKQPCVILLGEEAQGLSSEWLERADALIQIPMRGLADSLNVSVAGAVVLYEALRQRS